MSTVQDKRQRRPRARHKDVIFGCLEERLEVINGAFASDGLGPHIVRLFDLLDELKRSIGSSKENENE